MISKKRIKDIIEANKWFTYEEAESELKNHWIPKNSKYGDYLSMKRSQIQKILRSDIIGTYLEIHKRKKGQSDDDWLIKTIDGWSQKECFYFEYIDGNEKMYCEELHVFPKYDELFFDSDLEQSIILSGFDELLGDFDKVEIREVYEELYGGFGQGRTQFLMTEPYLFALKHEIERRQYPVKNVSFVPHSPKEIVSRLTSFHSREAIQKEVDSLIDEFVQNIDDEVSIHIAARNVEKQRFQDILIFLANWKYIYPSEIQDLENILIGEDLLKCFFDFVLMFNKPFEYKIDGNIQKGKLKRKYFSENNKTFSLNELEQKLKKSIYSFEKYELTKFENVLSRDTDVLRKAIIFRGKMSNRIYKILEDMQADSFLIEALENAGIRK